MMKTPGFGQVTMSTVEFANLIAKYTVQEFLMRSEIDKLKKVIRILKKRSGQKCDGNCQDEQPEQENIADAEKAAAEIVANTTNAALTIPVPKSPTMPVGNANSGQDDKSSLEKTSAVFHRDPDVE